MLASLSDGGTTTLNIDLSANESLSIVSSGLSYGFTSNQTFNNAGVAATGDFTGFSTAFLVLQSAGLTRYTTINITDSAAGARLSFADSGNSVYFDNITVSLNSGTAASVQFIGSSIFASNLEISTDSSIVLNAGAGVTAVGNIIFSAQNDITLNGGVNSVIGNVSLNADADANGSGILLVSPSTTGAVVEQQILFASGGVVDDQFGYSISVSGDGNTVLIGSPGDDVNGKVNQGSATIFNRISGRWFEGQQLTSSVGAADDWFGISVALSQDGRTAIVGAFNDDVGTSTNQGSAVVFALSGSFWGQQAILTASDGAAEDWFGRSVSLSADGTTAIVGADLDDIGANTNQGSATVFTRAGSAWTQQQKLVARDGSTGSGLGWSSVLSTDGNTAILSAPGDTVAGNFKQGSASAFVRSGSTWVEQQQLKNVDGMPLDEMGWSATLSADGNTALVGATGDDVDGLRSGSATVFVRSAGVWTTLQKLTAFDGAANDLLGSSVSLSSDGKIAIVGAPGDTVSGNQSQGSATVYVRSGAVWSQAAQIRASSGRTSDRFGLSTALSANGTSAFIATQDNSPSTGWVRAFSIASSIIGGSIKAGLGSITISASDADLQGTIAAKSVSIFPAQTSRPISLGRNVNNSLGVTDSELDFIRSPDITFGTLNGGPITVSNPISINSDAKLNLTTGSTTTVSGSIYVGEGGISIQAKNGITLNAEINTTGPVTLSADADANGTGTLTLASRVLGNYIDQTKLTDPKGFQIDQFGSDVAISADGKYAVVGATRSNNDRGAIMFFALVGNEWVEQQRVIGGSANASLGSVVELNADGSTAIVGESNGIATVYVRTGSVWSVQRVFTGLGNVYALALSADGSTALVGGVGATFFVGSGSTWTQQKRVTSTALNFGARVALSADSTLQKAP